MHHSTFRSRPHLSIANWLARAVAASALVVTIPHAALGQFVAYDSPDETLDLTRGGERASTRVGDWFVVADLGDGDDYPPLAPATDLLQWYRDGIGNASPGAIAVEETTPVVSRQSLSTGGRSGSASGSGMLGPQDKAWGGPTFSADAFEAELRALMDGEAVGYAYAINHGMQLHTADGWAFTRNVGDGSKWHSGYERMNIASISKTLTAVAVLQLLEKNGLSIHDPISPWLPADWNQAYGFDNAQILTFYDLLTHRSGLKQSIEAIQSFDEAFTALDKVRWDGLRAVVEYGIIPTYLGQYKYTNVNYALFRVMIPALWQASGEAPELAPLDETEAAAGYAAYMAENVLIPIGIHQAACHENGAVDPPKYYNVYDNPSPGASGGDWTLSCGSGGWYLSAYNLANLMANIRYNDAILSPAMRALMDEHKLGWSHGRSVTGLHGLYLAHGGALYFDDADHGDRREMAGCMMKFPIQVEAVLLVNSSINGGVNPCTKLKQGFDAAWVD